MNREDQETTNNISNWGECSQVCKQKESCNHWTWFSDGAVYQCITMSNYGSTETNKNAVSGDRDCEGSIPLPECPTKGMTTRNRIDQETVNDIRNYGECSQVCKQKETCNHWTWYSDGAVYQCITMSNYGSTETNKNAVSGDRDCEGIIHISCWL